ncbi:MAG: (2Fe-2S)-binding protein [Clostridia bacterium]|nr:(2Fe-2S)-binding protein [Clostridia bacterium]
MSEIRFYRCETCGNLTGMIHDAGVPMMCCGKKMTRLEPNVTEASREKHLPVLSRNGDQLHVFVGDEAHPMTEEHAILWVYLQTDRGGQRKCLKAGDLPFVTFSLQEEEPLCAYAWCNLHGLWKTDFAKEKACPLPVRDTKQKGNFTVCNCNNVSYYDILDAIHDQSHMDSLLGRFKDIKETVHCATGCGNCYDEVLRIISEEMNK